MICRVSQLSGTVGMNKPGSESGSSPWSATSGTSQPEIMTRAASTTMVISGAGMAGSRRGAASMSTRPSPTNG